jgi:hypothetical protein
MTGRSIGRAGSDRFIDRNLTILRMSPMEQIYGRVPAQHIRMRMKDLTSRQLFSVHCPRCGAATGHLCELHSGGVRFEPHLDRKLAAAEAVETKRTHVAFESRRSLSVNKAVHV